jgi:hypothetical protein
VPGAKQLNAVYTATTQKEKLREGAVIDLAAGAVEGKFRFYTAPPPAEDGKKKNAAPKINMPAGVSEVAAIQVADGKFVLAFNAGFGEGANEAAMIFGGLKGSELFFAPRVLNVAGKARYDASDERSFSQRKLRRHDLSLVSENVVSFSYYATVEQKMYDALVRVNLPDPPVVMVEEEEDAAGEAKESDATAAEGAEESTSADEVVAAAPVAAPAVAPAEKPSIPVVRLAAPAPAAVAAAPAAVTPVATAAAPAAATAATGFLLKSIGVVPESREVITALMQTGAKTRRTSANAMSSATMKAGAGAGAESEAVLGPPKLTLLPGYPRNVAAGAPGGMTSANNKRKSHFSPFRKNQVSMPYAFAPRFLQSAHEREVLS